MRLLYAALLLPLPALAVEQLPTMVVTASGSEEPLEPIPASLEIIDAEQIARMPARDLGDLLRMVSGIELSRNGGPGQTASLFVRGAESDHTLVLIDGVPMQSGSVGATAIQHIDPALIERIEILKGPRSIVWGSGAIGGVVHVITRAGNGAGIEAGGDNSLALSAALAGGSGAFGLAAGLSHRQTDGFPVLAFSELDRGYRNDGLLLQAGYRLDAASGLHAEHWQAQGNNEYQGYFGEALDQDYLLSRSSLEWYGQPGGRWDSRLLLSLVRDRIDQNQSAEQVHTDRWLLEWRNELALTQADDLGFGISRSREQVDAVAGFAPYAERTDATELWGLWSRHWQHSDLSAGVRWLDHEAAGDHWVWNLNYGYRWSAAGRLWAGAGTAFRYPSANERFGFGGNPDLEPEHSLSFELGTEYRPAPDHRMRAVLFRNDIDDLIEWRVVEPPFVGINRNVASARIQGLELGWDWRPDNWAVKLGGVLQDPRNRDSDELLLRRARYSLNLALDYFGERWEIGLSALHSGEREDFGGVELSPYTLVNLHASYRLDRDWQLFGKIENLFDEQYALAEGYNTQDRIGFVGIRFQPD